MNRPSPQTLICCSEGQGLKGQNKTSEWTWRGWSTNNFFSQHLVKLLIYRVSERRSHFLGHNSGVYERVSMGTCALGPEIVTGGGRVRDNLDFDHKKCVPTEYFTWGLNYCVATVEQIVEQLFFFFSLSRSLVCSSLQICKKYTIVQFHRNVVLTTEKEKLDL